VLDLFTYCLMPHLLTLFIIENSLGDRGHSHEVNVSYEQVQVNDNESTPLHSSAVWKKKRKPIFISHATTVSENINELKTRSSTTTSCILFFVAISIHSVLEGLGLGSSTGKDVWGPFVAILAHKGLAGFAVGANLVRANMKTSQLYLWGFAFAILSPVSCVAAFYLTIHKSESFTTGVFLALASGSFIYVGLLEGITILLRI